MAEVRAVGPHYCCYYEYRIVILRCNDHIGVGSILDCWHAFVLSLPQWYCDSAMRRSYCDATILLCCNNHIAMQQRQGLMVQLVGYLNWDAEVPGSIRIHSDHFSESCEDSQSTRTRYLQK
jgi:hypothetical protein